MPVDIYTFVSTYSITELCCHTSAVYLVTVSGIYFCLFVCLFYLFFLELVDMSLKAESQRVR